MPSYDDIEEWIRDENDGDDSVDDQVTVAHWFWDREITILKDRVARTSQVNEHIEHRLDYEARTSLDNLEEIGVLVQLDPPGSGTYIRHHRSGENFYDPSTREFVPLLEEDISRFLDDLASRSDEKLQIADGGEDDDDTEDSPKTLRGVAAVALEVEEPEVENSLTGPTDPVERMNRYDSVAKAVKDSEEVSRNRNYDEMGWRNSALRWTLSERAAHTEANHSLPS